MTAIDNVLAGYEKLLERSTRMLAWARQGDWAQLVREESDYVQAVDDLKRQEAECRLDAASVERKADLLERILEQDLETRLHLETRRDELGEMVSGDQRRRDLGRAYGAGNVTPLAQGRR